MALVTIHTIVARADLLLIMMRSRARHGIEAAGVVVQEKETMVVNEIEKDLLIIELPAEDHHQRSLVEKDFLVVNVYILYRHYVGEI
jgi:hypothetical protein